MAQGRPTYPPEDGLDPSAQYTNDQEFMEQFLKTPEFFMDTMISSQSATHGQQTHAGTTPTLISSPGNQSATASSAFPSPHLTTPPTSYDHQPFSNNNNLGLIPLFSSTNAPTAPQGGHAPLNLYDQGYSTTTSNTNFPQFSHQAGPSRVRSQSPTSTHLNPILSEEISINSILQHCDPKEVESRLKDYNNFTSNPRLQFEWLRIVSNWVVKGMEPLRDDHFHFLSAYHAPLNQKLGGPGSRGGPQSYTCLWPGCDKVLKSRADRAQEHVLEHLEIKPFHCKICETACFLRKNDCTRHEKSCRTASTSRLTKRKIGPRTAPYPEINTRRNARTSNGSRSATESPLNLYQMSSPLHVTNSPLSPCPPQQPFYLADTVLSSSPTLTRYSEAQLQSPLRGYPLPLPPTASSSIPVVPPNTGPLLFQHMLPIPNHPPPTYPPYPPFEVQRSPLPPSNGSNDSFMHMHHHQATPDLHPPFSQM